MPQHKASGESSGSPNSGRVVQTLVDRRLAGAASKQRAHATQAVRRRPNDTAAATTAPEAQGLARVLDDNGVARQAVQEARSGAQGAESRTRLPPHLDHLHGLEVSSSAPHQRPAFDLPHSIRPPIEQARIWRLEGRRHPCAGRRPRRRACSLQTLLRCAHVVEKSQPSVRRTRTLARGFRRTSPLPDEC